VLVNMNALVETIVAWLPMIIFLGIWFFIMTASRKNSREIMDMNREILGLSREALVQNQNMSDTLLRIEKLMEDRKV
jgi:ATP-dependent Zn protease